MDNRKAMKHVNKLYEEITDLKHSETELKAELTYWKETAKNWKDLYKETDSGLQYLKAYSSSLEKALNNLIKTVDK